MLRPLVAGLLSLVLALTCLSVSGQTVYEIQPDKTYVTAGTFSIPPTGGDTVRILAPRTKQLKFVGLHGEEGNPIVFINSGGQVNIETTAWGALEFLDCQFIKVSGTGDLETKYGFKLFGIECGLAFSGYSSDCEAEFIEITGNDDTFFGIYAKKDFGGNPPIPYPQFNNLIIHDMYIHDVSEGMYIGETKSPGMEFRHVRIYNNIIADTHRESIQIANCVEDVEIYNNLMINSGLHHLDGQSNVLQIGGNSIARVYNNIMKQAPDYGVIILGMGHIEVFNNYLEDCKGVFIDNRYWTLEDAPIVIDQNYFKATQGYEVIRNMNEYCALIIKNNLYDTNIPFFLNVGDEPPVLSLENNSLSELPDFGFILSEGMVTWPDVLPEAYSEIGPFKETSVVQPEVTRIILHPEQIIDLVPRGSLYSPKLLVDEQHLDPDLNDHPASAPWIPAKNMRLAPYHVEIQLDGIWYLDRISFHVLRKTGAVDISYLVDNQWIYAFTEDCSGLNTWKDYMPGIETAGIRLTMQTSLKGEINEVALYGYKISPSLKTMTGNKESSVYIPKTKDDLLIYPNPASDYISLTTTLEYTEAEIVNHLGQVVISSAGNQIRISDLPNGMYFLRVKNTETGSVLTEALVISR